MDCRVKPGNDEWIDMRHYSRGAFLLRPSYAAFHFASLPQKRIEGARDAGVPVTDRGLPPLPAGPAGPSASRHRGGATPLQTSAAQTLRSPPVARRPARGVYRLAPCGPRWTDLSGAVPFR
jgi:hypothetical protein